MRIFNIEMSQIKYFVTIISVLTIFVLLSISITIQNGQLIHNDDYYNTPLLELQALKRINKILDETDLYNLQKDILIPPLYIITPTYQRPEQLPELVRLGYTLKHINNLMWLVIEDAQEPSLMVTKILKHIGVPFQHLIAPMPEIYKVKNKSWPRGVSNRNRGLLWIRENAIQRSSNTNNGDEKGTLYFADDDNTYDITIFEQMRYTKKISMWPVGLVTKYGLSSPIIKNNTLIGFYDGWIGGRKFPVDMAGFAVNVEFLLSRPNAEMPFKPGYEEDGFLRSLLPFDNNEIELLANNCTEILTWHTQSKKNSNADPLNMTLYYDTNLVKLREMMTDKVVNNTTK